MDKLQILIWGMIVGMCVFWLWWKISKVKEDEEIAKIFDDIEKEMSKERGAPVIIDEDVKELIKLRARADMFEEQDKKEK